MPRALLLAVAALAPTTTALPSFAQGMPDGAGAGGAPTGAGAGGQGGAGFGGGQTAGGTGARAQGTTGGGAAVSSGGGASPDALFGLIPVDNPRVVSLEEAMGLAVENNFDLRIAQEKVVQSEANVRRAWAAILPQVSLGGSYTFNYPEQRATLGSAEQTRQQALLYSNLANIVEQTSVLNSDPQQQAASREQAEQLRAVAQQLENAKPQEIVINPAHVVGANLTVTLPIFNGRALPLLQNAYEAVDLVKLTNDQVRTALVHSVARAYYSAVTAEKLVAIAERQVQNSLKHRDATRERVELGVATPLSLQRAELDVIRAEQQVLAAQNAVNIAKGALGNIIDVDEAFLLAEPPPMNAVELEGDSEALIHRALAERPDLLVQKASLAIAERNRLDAWMQFLPTVGLTAQGRWTSNTAGFVNQPFTGAVILNASIPLYDGGNRYAALRESGSRIREELLRIRQLEDRIEDQVRGNMADIAVKRQALVTAEQALDLSKKTAENAQNLYELGMATSLDVIDANLALFLAEIELARAQLELEQARLSLLYILGELPAAPTRAPKTLTDEEADQARARMEAIQAE